MPVSARGASPQIVGSSGEVDSLDTLLVDSAGMAFREHTEYDRFSTLDSPFYFMAGSSPPSEDEPFAVSLMSSTLDWIIACERQGLLTSADVRRFRQLAEITGEDFSPRVVLKWLTTRDRITADQADRILSGPPTLTPVDAIIRILGDTGDQSGTLELDSPVRDPDEMEEDTKELVALDLESVGDVALPPRGSPAFAESAAPQKSTAAQSASSPATLSDDSEGYRLSPDPDFPRTIDDLLTEVETKSEPLPNLRSKPSEASPRRIASPGLLIAAVATAIVLGIVVYAISRALSE